MANRFDNVPGLPQLYQQQSMVVDKPFIGTDVPKTPLKTPLDLYDKKRKEDKEVKDKLIEKIPIYKTHGENMLEGLGGPIPIGQHSEYNRRVREEIDPLVIGIIANGNLSPAEAQTKLHQANSIYNQDPNLDQTKKNEEKIKETNAVLSSETEDEDTKFNIKYYNEDYAIANSEAIKKGFILPYQPPGKIKKVDIQPSIQAYKQSFTPDKEASQWLSQQQGNVFVAGRVDEEVSEKRRKSGFDQFFLLDKDSQEYLQQKLDMNAKNITYSLRKLREKHNGNIPEEKKLVVMEKLGFKNDEQGKKDLEKVLSGDYSDLNKTLTEQIKNMMAIDFHSMFGKTRETTISGVKWDEDYGSETRPVKEAQFATSSETEVMKGNKNFLTLLYDETADVAKGTFPEQFNFANFKKKFGVDPSVVFDNNFNVSDKTEIGKKLKTALSANNLNVMAELNNYLIKAGAKSNGNKTPAMLFLENITKATGKPIEPYQIALMVGAQEGSGGMVSAYTQFLQDAEKAAGVINPSTGSLWSGGSHPNAKNEFAQAMSKSLINQNADKLYSKYDAKDVFSKSLAEGIVTKANTGDKSGILSLTVNGKEWSNNQGEKGLFDFMGEVFGKNKGQINLTDTEVKAMNMSSSDDALIVTFNKDGKTYQAAFDKNDSANAGLMQQFYQQERNADKSNPLTKAKHGNLYSSQKQLVNQPAYQGAMNNPGMYQVIKSPRSNELIVVGRPNENSEVQIFSVDAKKYKEGQVLTSAPSAKMIGEGYDTLNWYTIPDNVSQELGYKMSDLKFD